MKIVEVYPAGFKVYDENDNPCMTTFGYAKQQFNYNEQGEQLSIVYYDNLNQVLASHVSTMMVMSISGAILQQGIPQYSIIIKWNEWTIGESEEKLNAVRQRSLYGEKNAYFLTPSGEIVKAHVDRGLFGANLMAYVLEQSQVDEILAYLKNE